jgi:putative oxidoreductase
MDISATPVRPIHANGVILAAAHRLLALLENWAAPVLDLGIRLFVARVFFLSGLVKIQSWDSTLALFENEYAVPLLSPELAAYAGTFTELFFPVVLALGLGARFAAAVLFVFNAVAVISYPDLSEVGLMQHQFWGVLLLVTLLHGPGKLSIDHLIRRRFLA